MTDLDCPHCEVTMIKSYGHEAKLRSKLVKWTSEGMFAVCKSCGHDVPISSELLKSMESTFIFEIQESKNKSEK